MTPKPDREPNTSETASLLRIELDCPWCLNATIHALQADPHTVLRLRHGDRSSQKQHGVQAAESDISRHTRAV